MAVAPGPFRRWLTELADFFGPGFDPATTWEDVGGLDPLLSMIDTAKDIILRYSNFEEFREHWKWRRILVPLQLRLVVEQMLWDMGLPWRSLITGFRAIEGDAGDTGVYGPASSISTPKLNQTPSKQHACPDGFYWDRAAARCLPIKGWGGE